MARSRVRVYIACSLDGFIAGTDNDLSWLHDESNPPPATPPEGAVGFEDFMADVGAMLMGRSTFDVVHGFDVPWPYGQRPVLVATHRDMPADAPEPTRAATGDIHALVQAAKEAADGKDVYVDGGQMVRQALDAGLIDELIVTIAPIILGQGLPLFAGTQQRHRLELVNTCPFGGDMVQMTYKPVSKNTP